MEPFVLDASVSLAWCFDDEANHYTEELLDWCDAGTDVYVPSIWAFELTNILVQAHRKGRVAQERVDQFIGEILRFAIHVEPLSTEQTVSQVRQLSENYRLTAYDAAYLAVALNRGLPLASQDSDLKAAAIAAGVRLVDPLGAVLE
jgi:predicted nucleic acid-binding protein